MPREVCQNVTVREPGHRTGAGALMVALLAARWAMLRAVAPDAPPPP
ncbi:MAG: hypothetical protein R3E42_16975 [Burkholderiaceae bacterium]